MKTIFLIQLVLICNLGFSQVGQVSINISNIRNNKGSIRLGVYQNEKQYKTDQAFVKKIVKKNSLTANTLTVDIPLAAGVYGIALMDDENDNGKMDFGFILPEEGFGFSNIYHEGLSKPDYKKITFKVEPQKSHLVHIKMRYM
jgi:uncharacterized protein (DUF2141 family)